MQKASNDNKENIEKQLFKNIVSLGYFCSVAIDLEKMGLRNYSLPFDWVVSSHFCFVLEAIKNRFSNLFLPSLLYQSKVNLKVYRNKKYMIDFYHDFNDFQPLDKQLPFIKEKYERRIERFYETITKPTLFIRYVCSSPVYFSDQNESNELVYIEKHYEEIYDFIKSFNKANEIIFIGNEGIYSKKVKIYNVCKDKQDVVARHPLFANCDLSSFLRTLITPQKNKIYFFIKKRIGSPLLREW